MTQTHTKHETRVRYLGSETHSAECELFPLVIEPSESFTGILKPPDSPGVERG